RRPCLDLVRVLARAGRDKDVGLVAAKLLGQSAPFGLAGENFERPRAARGQEEGQAEQQAGAADRRAEHGRLPQKMCAPCAPRLMMYCRIAWSSAVPRDQSRLYCRRKRPNSLVLYSSI